MKTGLMVSWIERSFSSAATRLAVLLLMLTASFVAQAATYSLIVGKNGVGAGVVSSTPGGISCGAKCFDTYVADDNNPTIVILSAAPAAGSRFNGWQVFEGGSAVTHECNNTKAGTYPPTPYSTCAVVMDKARTVIATFDHPSTAVFGLTVKMDSAGSGSGTVTSDPGPMYCGPSCYGSYAENSEVTLTATPAAGSIFVAWTDTGATCTESTAGPASCVVKMTEKTTVTAKFDKDPKAPKNLSVIKAGAGAGIVSSDPAGIYCGAFCNETFPLSTLVRLSAAPNSGSIFTGWSGDAWSGDACSGGDLQALTCEVTMDMARSVTATFNLASTSSKKTLYLYKLGTGSGAVTSDPAGIDCPASGCSNASASFDSGTPVTLTATHAQGSSFTGWSGGGSAVTVNDDVAVNGAAKTVTLTLATAVTKGQSVTLAYTDPTTANDGNAIQDVFGNDTISVPVISVTNLTGATGDTMPPKFVQATANGNTLVMSYVDAASKLQDPSSSISTAAFTVKVADVARTVKEVKVNGTSNTVTLTLDPVQVTDPITHDVTTEPAVTEGKSVTVAYTAPATGAVIRDTALNPAATLVATNVTNLTGTQVDFLPPTFALATVNNNKLVLSYTGPYDLNENNLPVVGAFAVQVGGVKGCIGSATTCEVTMDTAKTVTATFDGVPPSFFTVHIGKMGAGTGTIKSSGVSQDPIDCDRNNKDCDGSFTLGTPVILKATADSDSKFTEWTGCTNTPSSTEDCYVLKTLKDVESDGASYGVTATFTKASASVRTLTVTKLGTGTGLIKSSSTPSSPPVANQPEINCGGVCNVDFPIGVTVILTASPGTPAFTGWKGACTGTLTTCTFTMESGKSVIATFIPSVTASLAGTGRGVVTSQPAGINCGGSCTAIFASGSSAILTATPNTGSLFAGWAGPCTGTAAACTVGTSVTQSVTAMFSLANTAPAKPGAPLISAADPGPGRATVSFAPPALQGSSPVIRYDASCQATGLSSATASGTESPIVVSKLTPRTAYACSVTAVNSVGVSPASAALSVTPSSNRINSILQLLLD